MTNTVTWQPHPLNDSTPEGDIGGDIQVSESWGAAFTLALPGGGEAQIVVAYFVANMGLLSGDSDVDTRDTEWDFITEMTMAQIKDASGEETWCDIAYDDIDSIYPTEEDCRVLARRFDPRFIGWDGTPNY